MGSERREKRPPALMTSSINKPSSRILVLVRNLTFLDMARETPMSAPKALGRSEVSTARNKVFKKVAVVLLRRLRLSLSLR